MRNRHAIMQRDPVRLLPTIIQRLVFLMPGIAAWLSLRERQKYGKWSVGRTEIGKSEFPEGWHRSVATRLASPGFLV